VPAVNVFQNGEQGAFQGGVNAVSGCGIVLFAVRTEEEVHPTNATSPATQANNG
jgi:hypothetical protein